MATIVRVKRRRDADPLEVLQLATKKQRHSEEETGSTVPSNLFKFAGTVDSKTSGVSQKVREAIRKDKLEKEYKRYQADILEDVHTRNRQQSRQSSIQNRFTVTAKHRALVLDNLDSVSNSVNTENEKTETENSKDQNETFVQKKEPEELTDSGICKICGRKIRPDREENSCKCNANREKDDAIISKPNGASKESDSGHSEVRGAEGGCDANTVDKQVNGNSNQSASAELNRGSCEQGSSKATDKSNEQNAEDRVFCLVDMEMDGGSSYESMMRNSLQDQITCNGETMVQESVSENRNDDEYVYDIYYTNDRNFDFGMFESDLTFEAMRREAFDQDFVDDDYAYEDDDDDENAEANWRNDYPEEDPGFLDNLETDYVYPNDMVGFGHFDTEETNQLADWMSWRMNLEDGAELSSDEDEVDKYETKGSTYEAYYKKVKTEMEGDHDSDN